jgi:dTDP-4-amino-4,6-dideoxygalactose transaminase
MKIPFLNIQIDSEELSNEINDTFTRVIGRGKFILGEEVDFFEREWAEYCGVHGAVGVANGTDAIALALTASGTIRAGRNDEVITTPLSAGYTALGIVNAGAVPVFVDIDESSLNLDPERIEQAITPRTRAILPVHLYGQSADMAAIHEIAERRNLIVIEDAAQAHGAKFDERSENAKSLAVTFSFYPTKNLGAYGDGGAVISNDADFLHQVRTLRQGGHFEALQGHLIGRNSRLDEMQAAFLRVKLKKVDEWNASRRRLAEIYIAGISNSSQTRLPSVGNGVHHAFHLFVIRHPRRDELQKFLAERNIETLIHYPYLLHQQPLFRLSKTRVLPIAEKIVTEILSLPLYPQMKRNEIEAVCLAIIDFEKESSAGF